MNMFMLVINGWYNNYILYIIIVTLLETESITLK